MAITAEESILESTRGLGFASQPLVPNVVEIGRLTGNRGLAPWWRAKVRLQARPFLLQLTAWSLQPLPPAHCTGWVRTMRRTKWCVICTALMALQFRLAISSSMDLHQQRVVMMVLGITSTWR